MNLPWHFLVTTHWNSRLWTDTSDQKSFTLYSSSWLWFHSRDVIAPKLINVTLTTTILGYIHICTSTNIPIAMDWFRCILHCIHFIMTLVAWMPCKYSLRHCKFMKHYSANSWRSSKNRENLTGIYTWTHTLNIVIQHTVNISMEDVVFKCTVGSKQWIRLWRSYKF